MAISQISRTLWSPGVVLFSQDEPDESEGEQAGRCVHNQIDNSKITIGQHPLDAFVAQTNKRHQSQGPDIKKAIPDGEP